MPSLDEILFLKDQFANIKDSRVYQLPSTYMESVRYLPKELTPKPGFYDYDYTPYLKEIVNRLSPEDPARKIVFQKPSQIGATVGILEAAVGYYIGCAPTSIMYISADKELVEKAVETKIEQMLESCGLRDKIFAQHKGYNSRATGNTKAEKQFPGGFLHAVGAQSAGKLRAMSYKVILMDELDGFPAEVGKEGSPVALAENRSNAFASKRKILYLSTPVVLQTSFISPLYLRGDQNNYFVKCPRCHELIVMQWHIAKSKYDGKPAGIMYEHNDGILIPESVHYKCQNCGKPISEDKKSKFMRTGRWIPTAQTQEMGLVSYWMDVIYSPPGMYSWVNTVYDWFKAWDVINNRVKDLKEYRSFRNTKQGKTFEEMGEALLIDKVLIHRRPIYSRNQIKNKIFAEETGSPVFKITCAVDVQKSPGELLVDIKAWCTNAISYTLDFRHLTAEKDVTDFNDKCWRDLENIIENEIWTSDDGRQYRIGMTFIDAAWGESTDTVYQFCRQYSENVYPTFGAEKLKDGVTLQQVSKNTIQKAGCMCYRINTVKMKDRVSRMLNAVWYSGQLQPMFYLNFPDDLREDYFAQFTAEHKVPVYDKKTNKFLGYIWKLIQGRDNHAFDLAGYHFAALELMAETVCINDLELESLQWPQFFEYMTSLFKKSK